MPLLLSQLSIDVLGLVLNHEDISYTVLDLWKSGDVLLRVKLASAVTYLRLRDTNGDSTSRYPRLVSSLRNLRYFNISRGKLPLMTTSRDLSLELQKLSSLYTLKIESAEANTCLLNHAPNWTPASPCYVANRYGPLTSSLVDMAAVFPSLKTLKLLGPEGALSTFAGLPPTLTSLEIPSMKPTAPALAALPRSLTKFKGTMEAVSSASDWCHAPLSLTSISQLASNQCPPMLQHTLSGLDLGPDLRSGQLSLPPDLRTLKIYGLEVDEDSPWTTHLPRKLESLKVYSALTPTSVASLPPTLTALSAAFRDSFNNDGSGPFSLDNAFKFNWPPLLTDIDVDYVDAVFLASISIMPCLKALRLHYSGLKLDGSILPRSLTKLHMGAAQSSLQILPGLPANLREIYITNCRVIGPESFQSFRSLPLQSLHQGDFMAGVVPIFDYLEPIHLPSTLKYLAVACWNIAWELPPSLTTLRIHNLLGSNDSTDLDPFKDFPPTLTHLEILVMQQTQILSKVSFSSLSRLRILSCPAIVHSSILRAIPRSITQLHLHMSQLDEADVPFLPPRLVLCKIDIPSKDLPSNIGMYWPLSDFIWSRDRQALEQYLIRKVEAKDRSFAYPDPRVVERMRS